MTSSTTDTPHLREAHPAQIAAFVDAHSLRWGKVAALLDQVERTGAWRQHASSYTEWLRLLADPLDLKEASLWRYLSSFRYYKELARVLSERDIPTPNPEDLSDVVSPEKLELLAKLSRVLPPDDHVRLAKGVVAGRVTRAELRGKWMTYRPALEGRTARGRGVRTPRSDPSDPEQLRLLQMAEVTHSLEARARSWLNAYDERFRVLLNRQTWGGPEPRRLIEWDAIVGSRSDSQHLLTLHGVHIEQYPNSEHAPHRLDVRKDYCHFLWTAAHAAWQPHFCARIPEYVGLLIASARDVKVIRGATKLRGEKTGETALFLLAELLNL